MSLGLHSNCKAGKLELPLCLFASGRWYREVKAQAHGAETFQLQISPPPCLPHNFPVFFNYVFYHGGTTRRIQSFDFELAQDFKLQFFAAVELTAYLKIGLFGLCEFYSNRNYSISNFWCEFYKKVSPLALLSWFFICKNEGLNSDSAWKSMNIILGILKSALFFIL